MRVIGGSFPWGLSAVSRARRLASLPTSSPCHAALRAGSRPCLLGPCQAFPTGPASGVSAFFRSSGQTGMCSSAGKFRNQVHGRRNRCSDPAKAALGASDAATICALGAGGRLPVGVLGLSASPAVSPKTRPAYPLHPQVPSWRFRGSRMACLGHRIRTGGRPRFSHTARSRSLRPRAAPTHWSPYP